MKIFPRIVVILICFQNRLTEQKPGTSDILSDRWLFCHGMSMDVFKKACACMLKLKTYYAEKYGLDTKEIDHWPIIGDRIFSLDDCTMEMNNISGTKKKKKKRRSYNVDHQPWPLPIHYYFQPKITNGDKKLLIQAMDHWRERTCIDFIYDDDIDDNNRTIQKMLFVTIQLQNGCYSFIGMQNSRYVFPQKVHVKSPMCTRQGEHVSAIHGYCTKEGHQLVGIPIHEIGHALGILHTQKRIDSKFWVNYYPENVQPDNIHNFVPDPRGHDFGVKYDYGSLMHYDNKVFSIAKPAPPGLVLEPLLPYSAYSTGQRMKLSFLDVKLANRIYCRDVCANEPKLRCKHGGYMDPKDCRKCRCPEGLGGRLCETAAPSDPGCSPQRSILEAKHEIQCVKSPGYDTENFYEIGVQCNWIIQAPPGELIRGYFTHEFGVYCEGSITFRGPMCFHWVEIKYKHDKEARGGRVCCHNRPIPIPGQPWNDPGVIVSEGNQMVVHFDGTGPLAVNEDLGSPNLYEPRQYQRRGFQFCFVLNSATAPLPVMDMTTTTEGELWWLLDEFTTPNNTNTITDPKNPRTTLAPTTTTTKKSLMVIDAAPVTTCRCWLVVTLLPIVLVLSL